MKSIYNTKIGYKTLVWHRYAKKKNKNRKFILKSVQKEKYWKYIKIVIYLSVDKVVFLLTSLFIFSVFYNKHINEK